jgi:hypothetical protein
MVIPALFKPSHNFTFLSGTCIKFDNEQVVTDSVTQVCVCKLQTWRVMHFGKSALRSSELLRAQTPKMELLPETGLIGPVQNLGAHQKFTFPNDTDLLCDFSP